MKIKDAAKMLGIPIETIRFYEKEGIVHPSRDENSGYRDYGLWDIFQLVACVNYRNTGMSVKEIARFLREGTRSDLLYFLNRSIEETQREINEKSQLQIVLQQFEKKLKYLPYNIGNYWVEDRDALCYVAGVQRNGSEYHQREGYWWREAEWIKKMPLTKSMQIGRAHV